MKSARNFVILSFRERVFLISTYGTYVLFNTAVHTCQIRYFASFSLFHLKNHPNVILVISHYSLATEREREKVHVRDFFLPFFFTIYARNKFVVVAHVYANSRFVVEFPNFRIVSQRRLID